jgi:hypothetical protein
MDRRDLHGRLEYFAVLRNEVSWTRPKGILAPLKIASRDASAGPPLACGILHAIISTNQPSTDDKHDTRM